MGIFVTQIKYPTFIEFLRYYCSLVETRILKDVDITRHSVTTYGKLRTIYTMLRSMKVDLYRFLDYSFSKSDEWGIGIPFPERLENLLKSYKDNITFERVVTIYDKVDNDIRLVRNTPGDLIEVYIDYNVCPFLPVMDSVVNFYIQNRVLPDRWLRLDDTLEYFKKCLCAYSLLDEFTHLRDYLVENWLPVLRVRRKNE